MPGPLACLVCLVPWPDAMVAFLDAFARLLVAGCLALGRMSSQLVWFVLVPWPDACAMSGCELCIVIGIGIVIAILGNCNSRDDDADDDDADADDDGDDADDDGHGEVAGAGQPSSQSKEIYLRTWLSRGITQTLANFVTLTKLEFARELLNFAFFALLANCSSRRGLRTAVRQES